jgi:hypothetical protein
MDKVRGILMLAVGAFALVRGFLMLGHPRAWAAIGLGVVALALGLFRILRKSPRRLV